MQTAERLSLKRKKNLRLFRRKKNPRLKSKKRRLRLRSHKQLKQREKKKRMREKLRKRLRKMRLRKMRLRKLKEKKFRRRRGREAEVERRVGTVIIIRETEVIAVIRRENIIKNTMANITNTERIESITLEKEDTDGDLINNEVLIY